MHAKNKLHEIIISHQKINLFGNLFIPEVASGLILFAHGSGSSRLSQRNQYVAQVLNQAGFATLLFDLLTHDEEKIDQYTRELRFNISLLSSRLILATTWATQKAMLAKLPMGYFGASTGAAAALFAAAQEMATIKAIVSRGGRPDLADKALSHVQAPTLLIVGGHDPTVIELNQEAMGQMNCIKKLAIVPGATHLFEEAGTLEVVAQLASHWFLEYLT